MDVLLSHYEQAREVYSDDPQMLRAIKMGWFVLDKYYTMSEDVPVYAAALLLDPSRRVAYIRQNWPQEWHSTAISSVVDLWSAEYEGFSVPERPELMMPPPRQQQENQLSQLFKRVEVKKKVISIEQDDLLLFTEAEPVEIDCTPLEWWCRSEQLARYPRLSRMAIDILSIPAESAEPERVFSGARRTTSWDRLSITCANIEKVECIGNWLREGLIKPAYEGGMGLVGGTRVEDETMLVDPALLNEDQLE